MILERATKMRDRLVRQLQLQRSEADGFLKWYRAEQDPPGLPRDARSTELYERIRLNSRNAWARLIVDAIAERLNVQGYRSALPDPVARVATDRAGWAVLQANRIDAEQTQVHTEALITGMSYVLVSDDAGEPLITPETCFEVTHEWEPGGRREVRGAIKVFELDAGLWRLELMTPDLVFVWLADTSASNNTNLWALNPTTELINVWDVEPLQSSNPLGVVPVVPFENRPLLATGPLSELHDLVNVFTRVDELTLDKQVAAHFSAFRQKWATGLAVPRDPETGRPIEPFKAAVERLWIGEDPAVRFGSFESTDLSQYIKAIDAEIAELAAISRVPPHYLMSQNLANPPSADSLIVGESGLVKKVESRQRGFGESWEQVVRLALTLTGDTTAGEDRSSEVVWRDAKVQHPAQVADAAVKYDSVGVPRDAIWEFLGASPQEITRWRAMAAEDAIAAAAAALLNPPPPPPAPNVPAAPAP